MADPLSQEEWLKRYAARIMTHADVTQDFADECAQGESFAVLSYGFEDDPEGAADDEMTYWDEE